jgi:hypothetical protein
VRVGEILFDALPKWEMEGNRVQSKIAQLSRREGAERHLLDGSAPTASHGRRRFVANKGQVIKHSGNEPMTRHKRWPFKFQ